ncbi:MAG: Holliday junction branch migration protein RuvA [Spirochaetales bacterium]|nr:Holliday junction branch migration protein RuvA [Spirochaetales bacterium]
MFNSLYGLVSGHQFPNLSFRTGGIEWLLEVSATTFQAALAAHRDEEQRIFVYLHSREDLVRLYGFWTQAERSAFLELISVSGIGPRQALKILSGTTVAALTELLDREDVDALTRLPGLGKKTAQKMILQLKGHLVVERDEASPLQAASRDEEILRALVEMGFDRGAAQAVLDRLIPEIDGEGAGDAAPDDDERERELFRRAIVALSAR